MKTPTRSAMLCIILLLQGCGCMSHVTVANNTDVQFLVDVSLPYPGYGFFRSHCQFTTLMEPGQSWNSLATRREDRVELPTGPHGSVLLRLINLDMEGWPNVVYSIGIEQAGEVIISGTWEELHVIALDRMNNDLQVWQDQQRRWFRDHRQPPPN